MADRTVSIKIVGNADAYKRAMADAEQATQRLGQQVTGFGKASSSEMQAVGRGALLMSGGLAVGLGLSAKAAVDWESAWAGVTKTVDPATVNMASLEEGLRNLAKELPATHAEIAGVAEAAGALGIQGSAIEGFTKTMIDLGETTDLTADQAATSMAQIANVMQTPQSQFERLGSTLVDLGNKGASTESEILMLAQRLAAAGKIAGLSEADVFAFASTLSSVGVEAEAGGTALSKVFTRIRDATIDGGADLETFARVAGVTAEEFASSFRDDPAMAIESFITGLGRMNSAGQSTTAVFKELDLNDERLMRSLLSTAEAEGLLAKNLDIARDAWKANTALQTEAEKRYDTTAAKLEIARNNVVDLGIDIGGVLLPALSGAAEAGSQMARGFGELPGALQGVGVGIAGVATAGLGMVGVVGVLGPKIEYAHTALMKMGTTGQFVGRNMGTLAAGLGLATVALTAFAYVQGENARTAQEAESRIKGFSGAIREAGDVAGGTEAEITRLVGESRGLSELMDATGTSVSDMADALQGSDADFKAFSDGLLSSAEAAGVSDEAMHALVFGLAQLRESAPKGAEHAATLGRVLKEDVAPGAEAAAGAIDSLPPVLDEAAKAALELQEAMGKAFGSFTEGADAYQAVIDASRAWAEATAEDTESTEDSWETYYDGFSVNTAEFIAQLEKQVAAQAAWAANLVAIAFRGRADLATELEKLGPEGAQIVAQFAGMTDAEFQHAADLWIASVSDGGAEMGIALQTELRVMEAIGRTGGKATAESIATSLGLGVPVVQGIAAKYGVALASIPSNKIITVTAETAQAEQRLGSLRQGLSAISQRWAANVHLTTTGGGGWGGREAGGLVRASGMPAPGPTDTIPLMVAPGEYVLRASAVRTLGVPALDALNSGQSPRGMAIGGPVAGVNLHQGGGATTIINHYYYSGDTIHASSIDAHHVARTIRDAQVGASRRGMAA